IVAPGVLLLIHMGRGLGMGDVKLAMALGAFLGPRLAAVSMLCGAVFGGLIALALLMRRGQLLSEFFSLCLIGIPFVKARRHTESPERSPGAPATMTMPYGPAIGIGALVTVAVYALL
ncbi:MAG TPA: prepilin peptidase, partial [Candidatus Krumholzibacteria bacterium]